MLFEKLICSARKLLGACLVLSLCVGLAQLKLTNGKDKFPELLFSGNSPNTRCNQSIGGFCTTRKECGRLGGKNIGHCAHGSRVCCSVADNCASSPKIVTVNGSHLLRPARSTGPFTCDYRLRRPHGVCQVRLDFNRFETFGGTLEDNLLGSCGEDTLVITGGVNANGLGPICGNLTGQHMYLDYGNHDDIKILMDVKVPTLRQDWDIEVTYIKCSSVERAPEGCLQYFTTSTGRVTSFNYPNLNQKNLQDYSICIKPLPGYDSITWQTCGGFEDFIISGEFPVMTPPGTPNITNPLQGSASCPEDWLMIYGVDRFCGNVFAAPVTTTAKPFIVNVHFDGAELPNDYLNPGFCMMWTQRR